MTQTSGQPADSTGREIGQRVQRYMLLAGVTQEQLAGRLGVTQGAVSRKLTGGRPWYPEELRAAADLLGVTVGELFGELPRPRRQQGPRRRELMAV